MCTRREIDLNSCSLFGTVKTTIFRYPREDLALICQTPFHFVPGAHVGFGWVQGLEKAAPIDGRLWGAVADAKKNGTSSSSLLF